MLVRQLAGRLAGEIVDLDFAIAHACLEAGTVAMIDAEQPQTRRRGRPPGSGRRAASGEQSSAAPPEQAEDESERAIF